MTHAKAGDTAQLDALAEHMERDLSAIRRAMRKPLRSEVAKGELTPPQTAVMRIVVGRPGASLRELAREVSLSHSTVSGIVDRLEKRDMVERSPDEKDGRIVRVRPTAQVTAWVEQQLPQLRVGPLQQALERAEPEEREAIAKAIARLRKLLNAAAGSI